MRFFRKMAAIAILLIAVFMISSCGQGLLESEEVKGDGPWTVGFSCQFKDTIRNVTPPSFTSKIVNNGEALGALPTDPAMEGYKFGGWYTYQNGYGSRVTENTKIYRNTIVYAYWYNYKVSFMNDGVLYASRGITSPDQTVRSLPASPTKSGYNFAGWWDAENCGGNEFLAGTAVAADKTVYACWKSENVYWVTYDSEGGSSVGVQYVVPPATTVGSLPPDPTRLFYRFDGWYTGKNGTGTRFTESTPVTSNMTVYAKWTATPGYTVVYNSYGGTQVDPQYVIPPATTVGALPDPPQKSCYTFDGWYTQPNGGGVPFTETSTVDDTTTVEGVLTVYAKWTWDPLPAPATYEIGDRGPSCVGKIFYIEQAADGTYGWEMAPPDWYLAPERPDQSADPSFVWIKGTPEPGSENEVDPTQKTLNGQTSTAFGTGMQNSEAIISQEGHTDSAAKMCRDYRGGGFDDWFLPSQEELALMFANKDVKRSGGFYDEGDAGYWSSSEYDAWDGWSQYFITGRKTGSNKAQGRFVRPVRRFKIS